MTPTPRTKTKTIWLIPIGMLFLALALAWPKFIHVAASVSGGRIDLARGVIFGVAIGLNLLAVVNCWARARCHCRASHRHLSGAAGF